MVSINVQTAILVLAFGICIVQGFKMPPSKCKLNDAERIEAEGHKNHTICFEKFKPGVDMETAYKNKEISTDDRNKIHECMNEMNGVISPEGIYQTDYVLKCIDEQMSETDPELLKSLKEGVVTCDADYDREKQCLDLMNCVTMSYFQTCYDPKDFKFDEEVKEE